MAVTHGLYGPFFENALTGNIEDLSDVGTEITLALMSSNHSFNQNHSWWSDVSANEISSTGDYAAAVLTGKSIAYGTSTRQTVFDAADVNYGTTVSIKAFGAVLYFSGATSTDVPLVSSMNFKSSVSDGFEESVDGTFEVQFHADGVFTVTVASV